MNTAEIRAALAAATPGPWAWLYPDQCCRDGYCIKSKADLDTCDGVTHAMKALHADVVLIANAPTWLAELLAEVDRLREDARAFAEALGFGDGRTEPAATLAQMIDPLTEAMSMARDHIECAVMCESCGEVLADDRCEECHGSGCLPNAELAYLECDTCAGVGRIHVGCAEASYAELAARAEAAEQAVQRVRDLAAHWEWFGSLWSTAARRILRALEGGNPS